MTEAFTLTAPKAPRPRLRRGGWTWGESERAVLRVLSLGAGVQSTTMALMAAHGLVGPMPDFAIFADTGDEAASTMEHLRWLESGNVLPFPIVRVSGPGRLSDAILDRSSHRAANFQPVPFYTEKGLGKRQCTSHWKIEPINSFLRERLGYKKRQRIPEGAVEIWIGMSTDEVIRAGAAHERWISNRYPLLEERMSRRDCVSWLVREGYPVPANSACVYCPFMADADRIVQRMTAPADFQFACDVDAALRAPGRRPEFVHPSRKPLIDLDLTTAAERGQGDMLMLCEGGCGL